MEVVGVFEVVGMVGVVGVVGLDELVWLVWRKKLTVTPKKEKEQQQL